MSISPFRSLLQATGLALLLFGLTSCGGSPKKTEIEDLEIRISAATNVNPDVESRPSPILLHILQLTDLETFNSSEYISMSRNDAAALGADVLGKTEVVLAPGEYKETNLKLNSLATYLGFVAGYRDIENAQWRIAQEIAPGKTDWIEILLDEKQIRIIKVND